MSLKNIWKNDLVDCMKKVFIDPLLEVMVIPEEYISPSVHYSFDLSGFFYEYHIQLPLGLTQTIKPPIQRAPKTRPDAIFAANLYKNINHFYYNEVTTQILVQSSINPKHITYY